MLRRGKTNAVEETVKGPAELHSLLRTEAEGLVVDAREGVVNDSMMAAVALGYDASR
jgi:hypothetical protein